MGMRMLCGRSQILEKGEGVRVTMWVRRVMVSEGTAITVESGDGVSGHSMK